MAAPASHMWYVRAAGGVWGPYPEARVAGFVAEGRVSAETPVSPWEGGPFAPAAASPEFAGLFHPPAAPGPPSAPELPATRSAQPGPAPQAPLAVTEPQGSMEPAAARAGPDHTPVAHTLLTHTLLVWAELTAGSAPGFHAALGEAGSGVTIRPGLWLVRAPEGAAALRNRLSRRLGAGDALLVVEAPLEQAAWFNLDPARDRELRRTWRA